MDTSNRKDRGSTGPWHGTDTTPIALLETIRRRGRVWEELAAQYGVRNPDPPWKITLDATCDMLAAESCVVPYDQVEPGSCALPSLERRAEEDDLSETIYADVPFPERQLLALAHSMIKRGLFKEEELAQRMKQVHERLTSA
ncbi:thiocyanate hydrolase subunit beta [Sulfurifustis variabilis]|uniref:Thiocyanate hydrolase subunit beta n=1 Tax=Sulfurifustis variabilis TaxID=1675686 RepID=A0A1B4V9A2_9GAMM|nr:hypothetical protein [Sulfurifustis variabilis]BAU49232.1 thiocyanate hydrolase subunit beta [Sulfurifustis variabilis]